mgnify:FL=1
MVINFFITVTVRHQLHAVSTTYRSQNCLFKNVRVYYRLLSVTISPYHIMFFIFHNVGKELIKDSKFTDCGSLVSTELQSQTLSELRMSPTHKNKYL